MRIIKVKNYDELSVIASRIIGGQILLNPNSVLGLATGSSPIGLYKYLIEDFQKGILDFSGIKSVNLDEYYGLSGDHDQSYRYFMESNLFNHVNINKENTYVPNGLAENIDEECARYENLIDSLGGVDLQLLGVGHNGHIGFNEPDTFFPKTVHCEKLTESTIKANSRLFEKVEDVPTSAFTMGIGTITKAKKILLIAGEDKADIIAKAITGPIDPQVPASILQLHKDVTIIYIAK